jgi:hypothetical protein
MVVEKSEDPTGIYVAISRSAKNTRISIHEAINIDSVPIARKHMLIKQFRTRPDFCFWNY